MLGEVWVKAGEYLMKLLFGWAEGEVKRKRRKNPYPSTNRDCYRESKGNQWRWWAISSNKRRRMILKGHRTKQKARISHPHSWVDFRVGQGRRWEVSYGLQCYGIDTQKGFGAEVDWFVFRWWMRLCSRFKWLGCSNNILILKFQKSKTIFTFLKEINGLLMHAWKASLQQLGILKGFFKTF